MTIAMQAQIRTTLGALADAEAALVKVLAVKFGQAGGAKVRYHAVKLAKLVAAETRHFYDERNALVTKYGAGEPRSIQPGSSNWSVFAAELKALSDVPVTLPWGPLTDAMIEPYAEIVAVDLLALGPLYELDPDSDSDLKKEPT